MASSRYKKSNAIQNHSSNKVDEAIERFANMMIDKMTALKNQDWEKSWLNGVGGGLPQNFSGRTYNASNAFFLSLAAFNEGYSMPVYMTFKQAVDNNLRINKGAESFPVIYWDLNIKDSTGNKLTPAEFRNLSKAEQEECNVIPILKYYNVFNVDQTNLSEVKPEKYAALKEKFNVPAIKDDGGMYTHNALDNLIKEQSWYCPIQTDKLSSRAYYSPAEDKVVVPLKAQFKKHDTEQGMYEDGMFYYSTLLHEMAHSTKGKNGIAREGGKFGDKKYAREELVAELTAAMIGYTVGFVSKITDNSAKYLDNWISVLKEEPKFIISVMSDVNKAADMILEKVDEQRLALGETPYLSKNMVTVETGYSLEPEFKPAQELGASEPSVEIRKERFWDKYGITSGTSDFDPELEQKYIKEVETLQKQFPDSVILFPNGNFYQAFGKDALKLNKVLSYSIRETIATDDYQEAYGVKSVIVGKDILESKILKLQQAGVKIKFYENLSNHKDYSIAKDLSQNRQPEKIEKTQEVSNSDSPLLKQFNEMKSKHPDAILLFRVGDFYETFKEDAVRTNEILGITVTRRTFGKDSIEVAGFPHNELSTALPELVRAGARVAFCEHSEQPKKTVKRGTNDNNQKKENTMAKKKSEKTDEKSKVNNLNSKPRDPWKDLRDESDIQSLSILDDKEKNIGANLNFGKDFETGKNIMSFTEIRNDSAYSVEVSEKDMELWKSRAMSDQDIINKYASEEFKNALSDEIKNETKKEETVKQPREPQLVTVNGDKITHAHIYKQDKDSEVNLFIAKMNGEFLRPVVVPSEVAADFIEKKLSVQDMMDKYYPTKMMQKIPDEVFKAPQKIETPTGDLNIEKFNVYKEKDQNKEDYGKYKFYAQVDGKKMSVLASQTDLNAYFDRVQTPSALVEKIFGEKLQLESHYRQFQLPEGFDSNEIRIIKDKESNKYLVYLDMGEAGRTKGKFLSYDDATSFFNKNATKDQIGAKYLSKEINSRVNGGYKSNKLEKTTSLKV